MKRRLPVSSAGWLLAPALLLAQPSLSPDPVCACPAGFACLPPVVCARDCPGPPPPPPPPTACSIGAVCFEEAGVFHVPTAEQTVRRIFTTPPVGEYGSIHAKVTVTHGGWGSPPSGRHNFFWFARNGNGDLFGYVNALGPGKNWFRLGHGVGVVHDEKARVQKKLVMKPGETYHLDYTYNVAQPEITLIVFNEAREEILRLEDVPNISSFVIGPKQKMIWDFGFTGDEPIEPATIGWTYQDLFVEFRE